MCGNIKSLGADTQIEPMSEADYKTVAELLDKAGFRTNPRNSNGLRRQSSFITGMQMLTRSIRLALKLFNTSNKEI